MWSMLAPFERYAYAVLRIVSGFLFTFHGLQKLFGLFGGQVVDYTSRIGLAAFIETIGGPLIMVGFLTAPAAFICSGEMAAAYFIAHTPRAFWPVQNAGEPAVLFCFIFLYIATRGAGVWSIEGARRRK